MIERIFTNANMGTVIYLAVLFILVLIFAGTNEHKRKIEGETFIDRDHANME